MDIVCKTCHKPFNLNPIETASASVNFSLGRTHTFYCDHCKAKNELTREEFEAIKSGKATAAPAPAQPAAPAPAARAPAPAPKPMAAAPAPAMAPKPVAPVAPPVTAPPKPEPKDGTVTVRSLRVRKDHNTSAEIVAGLSYGDKVKVLSTWTDGKNTWAEIGPDQWAAIEHNGEKMIEVA